MLAETTNKCYTISYDKSEKTKSTPPFTTPQLMLASCFMPLTAEQKKSWPKTFLKTPLPLRLPLLVSNISDVDVALKPLTKK